MKLIYYITIVLLSIPCVSDLYANDDYYRYIKGKRINMIIDNRYIVVVIDPYTFDGWQNLYNEIEGLDNTIQPQLIVNDIFQLKTNELVDIPTLTENIHEVAGVLDVYPSFLTQDNISYNIYNRLGVVFKNDLSEDIFDSIVSYNSLEPLS